jgi:hypothetical protein
MVTDQQQAKETISREADARRRLKPVVKSDWLPQLQELASQIPAFAPFLEDYVQLRLVIDANMVHEELQWRLGSRRDPDSRSALHECAIARVVILFAPDHLESEIQEHLPRIAERCGADTTAAAREWHSFRQLLHWYKPQSLELPNRTQVTDEDDLPYIAAWRELGADAIYSRDKHIEEMKAPTIRVALAPLRSYARGTTVRLAVQIGSVFTVTIGVEAVQAAVMMIGKAFRAFGKLPPFLQLAIVGGLAYVIYDPKMRTRFAKLLEVIRRMAAPAVEVLNRLAHQLSIEEVEFGTEGVRAKYSVPAPPRRTALALARSICLVHKSPISLDQLQIGMQALGYVSRARDFDGYLKRILRGSGQFIESKGMWQLVTQ